MEQTTPPAEKTAKTILLVDDDEKILRYVSHILNAARYTVLLANNGQQAMQQSTDYGGEIDLLLTDFQMPGMSGVELATKLSAKRPQMKVLMMSGFPDGMLVLNEGWHFMAKPFISSQLLALIVGLVSPDTPSKFQLLYP